jgi:hypothetical protein
VHAWFLMERNRTSRHFVPKDGLATLAPDSIGAPEPVSKSHG